MEYNKDPMSIRLAGYNVDKDAIDKIKKGVEKNSIEDITRGLSEISPETVPASYARISRDPAPIPELRKKARKDIEGARKSNERIVFGYGHSSIAEHANFNFDIMGISRAVVEQIEKHRIGVGYTEKSQRYITLDGDFVVPKEIQNTEYEKEFLDLIEMQNKFYKDNLEAITQWHFENAPPFLLKEMGLYNKKEKERVLRGRGKEDARYVLALATQTQLGMTSSARSLEYIIKSLRSGRTIEEKEIGKKLLKEAELIAPSLIKYTEPTDYLTKTHVELEEFINKLQKRYDIKDCLRNLNNLIGEYDDVILAGIIFSHSGLSLNESIFLTKNMTINNKKILRDLSIRYQQSHDPALREFELRDPHELILSASAFAQLKRHRMNTIITQDYNPSLGNTIPKSFESISIDVFEKLIKKTNELYYKLKENPKTKNVAHYVLTNSHRRRILLDANLRQVLAIAKERKNLYAQWDIRNVIDEYVNNIKLKNPIMLEFSPGKHEFDKRKKDILDKWNQ